MNALREQQENFARSVVEGVDEHYAQTIHDNGLSGARRLGIYHHGVALGLRDALGGVYGVVKNWWEMIFLRISPKNMCMLFHHKPVMCMILGICFLSFWTGFPALNHYPICPTCLD